MPQDVAELSPSGPEGLGADLALTTQKDSVEAADPEALGGSPAVRALRIGLEVIEGAARSWIKGLGRVLGAIAPHP